MLPWKPGNRQFLPVNQNLSSVHFSLANFQLVSSNLSLAMIWQMTYNHKLPKLRSATLSPVCRNVFLKNSNKRSDHLATRETASVFYLALEVGYVNKTHTHTYRKRSWKLFISILTITKPFSPFYLDETTWWAYCLVSRAVSQLIMRGNKPTFAYKLAPQ